MGGQFQIGWGLALLCVPEHNEEGAARILLFLWQTEESAVQSKRCGTQLWRLLWQNGQLLARLHDAVSETSYTIYFICIFNSISIPIVDAIRGHADLVKWLSRESVVAVGAREWCNAVKKTIWNAARSATRTWIVKPTAVNDDAIMANVVIVRRKSSMLVIVVAIKSRCRVRRRTMHRSSIHALKCVTSDWSVVIIDVNDCVTMEIVISVNCCRTPSRHVHAGRWRWRMDSAQRALIQYHCALEIVENHCDVVNRLIRMCVRVSISSRSHSLFLDVKSFRFLLTAKCHDGDCPPCNKQTSVKCRCGNMDQMMKCVDLSTRADDARCKKRCTKKRSCGKHKCNQECCIDFDHVCPMPCTYSLSCGKHKCDQTCHKGRCLVRSIILSVCLGIPWHYDSSHSPQPCYRTSFDELHCECGANVIYPPVPCGTKRPACDKPCSRSHPCDHPVTQYVFLL